MSRLNNPDGPTCIACGYTIEAGQARTGVPQANQDYSTYHHTFYTDCQQALGREMATVPRSSRYFDPDTQASFPLF